MAESSENPYEYIAYVDEAGDEGLKRVLPRDENGSSEWLIISGVVVRATREDEVSEWVSEIHGNLHKSQSRDLHFRKMSTRNREYVCNRLSELSARYFVVCSNKKNMRGYSNSLADKIPSQNWFYCWMTRILLERITDFVNWRSTKDFGSPRKIKIEYSNRGGMSYEQMSAYFRWINYQGENTFLKFGKIYWDVLDYDLLKIYSHYERAGLQIADVVASAFFKASDIYQTRECNPSFAKLLRSRMAKYRDKVSEPASGYGVKLLPSLKGANLLPQQKEIYQYYGYPRQWWDPDSSNLRVS